MELVKWKTKINLIQMCVKSGKLHNILGKKHIYIPAKNSTEIYSLLHSPTQLPKKKQLVNALKFLMTILKRYYLYILKNTGITSFYKIN